MTVERAKEVLLSLEGAVEGYHHGHPDFRVNKRIFATLWPDQNRSVVMIGPELAQGFAAAKGDGFDVVGGGKCLSIKLDSIEETDFRAPAETAWGQKITS